MKAAVVVARGQPPVYGDFDPPAAAPGEQLIRVTAAAISQLTRSRAAGAHYSFDATPPFIPGVDGAGVAADGTRVYFLLPRRPFGAMAEQCIVDEQNCIVLPDGLSEVTAAAMAIPGMSSWAALRERARLQSGETVLINGANGASGRLAVQIAKHLGAAKVIATGRQVQRFDDLRRLGADVTIPLLQDRGALEQAFKMEFSQRVDVVLDYLWGESAEALLVAAAKASPEGVPVRFVQIGSMSGGSINLPAAALRAAALELMGSGIGSVPFPRLLQAIRQVLQAAPLAGFQIATREMALQEVERVWTDADTGQRVVLVP